MRLALGRLLAALATLVAGTCPCQRCTRMEANRALMGSLRRHERRQLARDIVRRRRGPAT